MRADKQIIGSYVKMLLKENVAKNISKIKSVFEQRLRRLKLMIIIIAIIEVSVKGYPNS